MFARILISLVVALAACGDGAVAVKASSAMDYNHRALLTAVEGFVADGRTPEAYSELASTVLELRPGMDRTVGQEAELKLVVLALAPVKAVQAQPIGEQVQALALTVWPTLLAPPIAADVVLIKRDPEAVQLLPQPGEDTRRYLQRLCGGPLAGDCKQIVPEHQGAIVAAIATRRAMERARNAVSACVMCRADTGWHEAVRSWEQLDRLVSGSVHEIELKADPDNWPVAGKAAEIPAQLDDVTALWREATINAVGEVVIGGQRYTGPERIDALRDLRGDSETLTLNLRPELSLAQVKGILADAKQAGARKVAVIARAPTYPWERRIYWLSDTGKRVGLRPTDSLQLLLHTMDHVAEPGAVARVD